MRIRDFKDGRKVFIITGHDNNPANLYIIDKPEDSFMKYFIGYDINGNYYPVTPITTFKDKDTAKTMLRLWLRKAFYREINHIFR